MRIFLLGAYGQVGQELIRILSQRVGMDNIVCSDIKNPPENLGIKHHITLNSVDSKGIDEAIQKYNVK
jgi:dTDP-4-dehydrorhamnose reductase